MDQDQKKVRVAEVAASKLSDGIVLGVGTGSTVNKFLEIANLSEFRLKGVVSSSNATTEILRNQNIITEEPNAFDLIDLYIDGADEATIHGHLIKGGGGALTREKILAQYAREFICIIDDSKIVDVLGRFPLPIEVIPMASSLVAKRMISLGGQPQLREGFITDNGNLILDVYNLKILNPIEMESVINQIPGVVTVGIFGKRGADKLIIASDDSIKEIAINV